VAAADDACEAQGLCADPALLAEGWVRRTMTDPQRARELQEQYRELGFEVRLEGLRPQDFGAACEACALTACRSYVTVWTRRVGER
jgi:hypothetical protein